MIKLLFDKPGVFLYGLAGVKSGNKWAILIRLEK